MGRRQGLTTKGVSIGYGTAVLLGVLCAVVVSYDFSISSYLHTDDGSRAAAALQGIDMKTPQQPLLHWLMQAVSGSFVLVKAIPLLGSGLLVGAVFLILRTYAPTHWLAGAFALAIVFYPASIDQTFYIIGSHPTWGVALALYGLYSFGLGWASESRLGYAQLAIAGLLCLMASLTSPMLILAAFLPLIWLGICIAFDWSSGSRPPFRRILTAFVLIVPPIVFLSARGVMRNDYSAGGVNRIYLTADNILPALGNAVGQLSQPLFTWYVALAGCVVASLIVLSWFRWRQSQTMGSKEPRGIEWQTPTMALVLSGLAFAPNIAIGLDFFRPRYLVAPYVALSLFLAILSLQIARSNSQRQIMALTLALVVLAAAEIRWTSVAIHQERGAELALYEATLETVARENDTWSEEATVLFVVAEGTKTPTTWWTTQTLRYFTEKPNLIAMIMSFDELQHAVLDPDRDVQQQRTGTGAPSAEIWWTARREKGFRFLRKYLHRQPDGGLVGEQPLHVYTLMGGRESFTASPLVTPGTGQESYVIAPGQRPIDARLVELDLLKESCDPLPAVMLMRGLTIRQSNDLQPVEGPDSWQFSGTLSAQTVLPPPEEGERFQLRFRLVPAGLPAENARYSSDYPPMPFVATNDDDNLLAYQRGNTILLKYAGSGLERGWELPVSAEGFEARIDGRQGCRIILSIDGQVFGILPGTRMFTSWSLGKGIQDRFWTGEISDWQYYRE